MRTRTLSSKLDKLEDKLKEKFNKLWYEGGTAEFETIDGRRVEIDQQDVNRVLELTAASVWQNKKVITCDDQELVENIMQAKEGEKLAHYLKCMLTETRNNEGYI